MQFINYDINRRNMEAILKNSSFSKITEANSVEVSEQSMNFSYLENSQIALCNEIISLLFSPSGMEVDSELLNKFMDNMYAEPRIGQCFVDKIIFEKKYFKQKRVFNYNNLVKLDHIIGFIANSISNKNDDIFEMNFGLLYLGGAVNYHARDSKVYLSSLLKKRKVFSNKDFWDSLIDHKLHAKLLNKTNKKGSSPFAFLGSMKGAVTGFVKSALGSDMKEEEVKEIQNDVFPLLRGIIVNFANFDISPNLSSQLIYEKSKEYNQNNNRVELLEKMLKTYYFTMKKTNTIDEAKQKKGKVLSKNNILLKASKFLDINSVIRLIRSKHEGVRRMAVEAYGLLAAGDKLSSAQRICCWKVVLNYTSTVGKYVYKEYADREDIFANKTKSYETIDMDIDRTYFKENSNENRNKVTRILKIINYLYNNCYCQGMNYVCAFLLVLTNDEELTFGLMVCLMENTEYLLLFSNELAGLKKHFHILEKIILLKLPELSMFFKVHQ